MMLKWPLGDILCRLGNIVKCNGDLSDFVIMKFAISNASCMLSLNRKKNRKKRKRICPNSWKSNWKERKHRPFLHENFEWETLPSSFVSYVLIFFIHKLSTNVYEHRLEVGMYWVPWISPIEGRICGNLKLYGNMVLHCRRNSFIQDGLDSI